MKHIYLVTRGEYSDYGIHSAWSSKEKAETMVNILTGGKGNAYSDVGVEEWELDDKPKEYLGWVVQVLLNTGKEYTEAKPVMLPRVPMIDTNFMLPNGQNSYMEKYFPTKSPEGVWMVRSLGGEPLVPTIISSYGDTPELALKAARDYRAQVLAHLEGI